MDLKDKVVFISGSSRGIGLSCAKEFAKRGANVILNARKEVDPAIVEEIKALGVNCDVVLGDIADEKAVKTMVKTAYKLYDRIDVLVNNAGINRDMLMIGMKPADFAAVVNVNLTGTYLMSQAFLKKMYKQKSGVIINMSSVVGLHGNIGQANYAASKAGIVGLTKTIAKEGAMRNVRCNAVAPGMIVSDMTDALSDKVKDQVLTEIPLKRFGEAKEVAHTVAFLAENDYITGQTITVDGGMAI